MTNQLELRVAAREQLTEDIVGLTLESVTGGLLPEWQPGAHIELSLNPCVDAGGNGGDNTLIRHYSLCSDPANRQYWQIAVLKEENGRGGSLFIHNAVREGDVVRVSEPRNNFPFVPRRKCLFIAGGIGITPILPMIRQAEAEGVDWRLVYLARERSRLAFLEQLAGHDPERVRLNGDKEDGFIDLPALLSGCDAHTSVYSCGPQRLLDSLEDLAAKQSEWSLHIERFSAGPVDASGGAFDVVINSTGQRYHIPEGQSILNVLREAGVKVPTSCGNGVCGTCETGVLAGVPDHRDSILSPEEREENAYMMLCVSRALSPEIVLDL
ncbi:PDR/VanB family oxidoreductase [Oceanimonas sp. CHS3-5]|uniref:PDR/VanB family oxidoreductase n=1 Tax=Oceanimonas sp. CHS3-5 TaxID=3068186 RepID=UPI0027400741|nr:PDR/VanB family oxidoreductase [Oceanimonas sp. CHS3-5]MDP5291819.1 PDR/VanB family oxidoreductase [Oceanimonas sp. CHS3-5]